MGLGPAVCKDCKIYADLDNQQEWFCPVCGKKENDLGHIWEQPDQAVYDHNQKFIKFIKGQT